MSYTRSLAEELGMTVDAYLRCVRFHRTDWIARHRSKIRDLQERLPGDLTVDLDDSHGDLLYLNGYYKPVDDNGVITGVHVVHIRVTPSFLGGFAVQCSFEATIDKMDADFFEEALVYALSERI